MSTSDHKIYQTRRNDPVTCLSFGPERKGHWEGAFFCSPCDAYEAAVLSGNRRVDRNSRRMRCTAVHRSKFEALCKDGSLALKKSSGQGQETSLSVLEEVSVEDKTTASRRQNIHCRLIRERTEDLETVNSILRHQVQELEKSIATLTTNHANEIKSLHDSIDLRIVSMRQQFQADCQKEINAAQLNLQIQISTLEQKVAVADTLSSNLAEKVKHYQASARHYKRKWKQMCLLSESVEEYNGDKSQRLRQLLDIVLTKDEVLRKCKNKRRAKEVAKVIWDDDILGGELHKALIELAKKKFRKHIFSPAKIMREMDISGAELNFAGLELMRRVERNHAPHDKENKRFHGMLPSRSQLAKVASIVRIKADAEIPIEHFNAKSGEGWRFKDLGATLNVLLRAFGLHDKAKEHSVDIGIALDAAPLTKSLSIFTLALTICDHDSIDPITGERLDLYLGKGIQSRNLVFPVIQIIGKETKENLLVFEEVFKFFDTLSTDPSGVNPEFKVFKTHISSDMACQWKVLGVGCGAKSGGADKLFCSYCGCRNGEIHLPSKKPCSQCMSEGNDKCCFHHDFIDSSTLEFYKDGLSSLQAELPTMEFMSDVRSKSQIEHEDWRNASNDSRNPHSLDFLPQTETEAAEFEDLLARELMLRDESPSFELEDMRSKLRAMKKREEELSDLLDTVAHLSPNLAAMVLNDKAVPCILHAEMRIGIKVISMVLGSGLDNFDTQADQKRFAEEITELVNLHILGDENAPGQWNFPTATQKRKGDDSGINRLKVGEIRLTNTRVRQFMENMFQLVEKCCPEQHVSNVQKAVKHYKKALGILCKKTSYTNNDIKRYRHHANKFMRLWVQVYSYDGMTNYIHNFTSGHFEWFMREFECLHRYSQQGFESMNGLTTSVFFRRTQRGGNGQIVSPKSKLMPVGRWFQRRLMWLCYAMEDLVPSEAGDTEYSAREPSRNYFVEECDLDELGL